MKTFLCIAIMATLPLQCLGATFKSETGIDETSGETGSVCFVYDRGWPDNDSFWYCGKQNKNCAGVKDYSYQCTSGCDGGDTAHWLYHGENFSRDGKIYWCCNGTKEKRGIFIESNEWTVKSLKTISVQNGRCSYYVIKDVCGNIITDEPCTDEDICNAGYVKRNGECVKLCDAPYVFESKTSNRCILCDETPHQATVETSKGKYCLTCDPSTEFINKTTEQTQTITVPEKFSSGLNLNNTRQPATMINTNRTTTVTKCVPKTDFTVYQKEDIRICWRCKNQESITKCILGENIDTDCPLGYTR